MTEKMSMKGSEEWYNFLIKLAANRVKCDMELRTLTLSELPDLILKYFKMNNKRYLELVNLEYKNGNK